MARKITEPKKINFKESLASLAYVPQFFKEVYSVNPSLFILNVISRLLSAFTPLVMLYIGKLIIDEVV
ncbi:MAG: hypothetical protein R3321_04020, partial [Nitrososphaeraceae archaeon]|nr:hypothetical protein [Nitrososphaeraceae archaeon]